MTVARERWKLGDRGLARIGHDDVEGEVRERPLGIAQAAVDPSPKRSLLVDHRADRRDPACDRGTRAMFEVIQRREGRGAGEMRVEIDAARQHELPGGVEVARRAGNIADRDDAPVLDTDVRASGAARGHDGAAADR